MKILSPVRLGLALSLLTGLVFGCDGGALEPDGTAGSAGVGNGPAAGSPGASGSAGTPGTGGTAPGTAGAGGVGTSGASSGGTTAGGMGTGGGAAGGPPVGSAGTPSTGGSSGAGGGGGGTAGSGGGGGMENNGPPMVTAGACKQDLGGYQNGWVTWYTFSQGTELVHCSFPTHKGNPDKVDHIVTGGGTYFGAMNTSDYEASAVCGACVEVTRGDQNKKVTITIVDECPISTNNKCVAGHIDLSQEAFKQLGSVDEGYLGSGKSGSKGQISWKYVPCPESETVHFTLKEHDNPNWNQVRVSGNRWEIAKVEVRRAGTWVNAKRQVHNYWEPEGGGSMGTVPYRVRVTDVNGSVIEAPVQYAAGEQDSGVQFKCN